MFGIIRVRNLNSSDVSSTEKHNFRLYEKQPQHLGLEKNILNSKEFEGKKSINYINKDNVYIAGKIQDRLQGEKGDLKRAIESRFEKESINPRKNSVVALEYVLAISPDAASDIEEVYNYQTVLTQLSQFIEKKHGKENVIAKSFHFDESNPHVHVIVTPIKEKLIKWKNKGGVGEKTEKRLCARDFTGNKKLLSNMQTDFFYHCSNLSIAKLTEHRFKRGMGKKERLDKGFEEYDKRTNAELGKVREQLKELSEELKNVKSLLEIQEIEIKLEEKNEELREIAKNENLDQEKRAKISFDQTTQKITERYTQNKPKRDKGMNM